MPCPVVVVVVLGFRPKASALFWVDLPCPISCKWLALLLFSRYIDVDLVTMRIRFILSCLGGYWMVCSPSGWNRFSRYMSMLHSYEVIGWFLCSLWVELCFFRSLWSVAMVSLWGFWADFCFIAIGVRRVRPMILEERMPASSYVM
ncbi:hypothetical protein Nepgr_013428 [Nepenthes gracilis]|uniref:Uncharacterized protein n=1 Tax=Nepenthes gracilis TaxID=150966 RepID=A0AAD3SI35_NEPGR|nr:hypothetical protein Nepgr_013428 [Nepenthes gracilis]